MVTVKRLKSLTWESKENDSVEEFTLLQADDGFILKGTVSLPKIVSSINYEIRCNQYWKTKSVCVNQRRGGKTNILDLKVAKDGVWSKEDSIVPFASNLLDVDLEFSPSTNTLTIRRLNLKIGQSKEVESLWVRLENLNLERLQQRYSRIDTYHYKYEGLSFPYGGVLTVDELGLIVDYGELWHRTTN